MTDIEQKALALLKECVGNAIWKHPITRINRQSNLEHEALCRAIEQHEAFKQEVSDELREYFSSAAFLPDCFHRFIIPAPKPDPLREAIEDCAKFVHLTSEDAAEAFRAALEARGLEIRSKNDD